MSRVTVNVVGDVELLSFEAFSHAEHAELLHLLRTSLLDDHLRNNEAASGMERLATNSLLPLWRGPAALHPHHIDVIYWPLHKKCLAFTDSERGYEGLPSSDDFWLHELAVSNALRNQKLGSILLRRFLVRVGNNYVRIRPMRLSWHPEGSDPTAFYHRFGFVSIPSSGGEMEWVPPGLTATDSYAQSRLARLLRVQDLTNEHLQEYRQRWTTICSAPWTFPTTAALRWCLPPRVTS
jgi:ribosomal protein S18 acetylase RimI-like enzyme